MNAMDGETKIERRWREVEERGRKGEGSSEVTSSLRAACARRVAGDSYALHSLLTLLSFPNVGSYLGAVYQMEWRGGFGKSRRAAGSMS